MSMKISGQRSTVAALLALRRVAATGEIARFARLRLNRADT
jgi:hypothetical protein